MGRPLNPRYFGPPTDGGDEIRVRFWDGTTEKNGWIVKQTGAKRFVCTDGVTEANAIYPTQMMVHQEHLLMADTK